MVFKDIDINSDMNKYKGTLSRILYELNYERNKNPEEWGEHQKNYFLKIYGIENIEIIRQCIQHYFENKDIDLSEILPVMNATIEEKEDFLNYILSGFKKK